MPVTVLRHANRLATKRWYYRNGQIAVEDYDEGKWFTATTHAVDSADDLLLLLQVLDRAPHSFVIRGEILPGQNPQRVRRAIKKDKFGNPAGFAEVPRDWFMLDCDKTLAPDECADLDVTRVADIEEGVHRIVAKLPPCFHDATVVWQLSASAGMRPGFRVHLWYMLDRKAGERELTSWIANLNESAGRDLLDPVTARPVQPHYIARPVFDVGIVDPCATRVGLVRGARDTVSLPVVAVSTETWRDRVRELRQVDGDTHGLVRDAAFAFFCERGATVDAGELKRELRAALDAAIASGVRGGSGKWNDDVELDTLIDSGREAAKLRGETENRILKSPTGTIVTCIANAIELLDADPTWGERVRFNARAQEACIGDEPLNDNALDRAVCYLTQTHGMVATPGLARDALRGAGRRREFDPVRDYLDALVWDGTHRLDLWLSGLLGVDDCERTRLIASMFLIGAVARTYEPGCKFDTVLVLEGDTGIGKSSTIGELFGREYFADDCPISRTHDQTKAKEYIQGKWAVEFQEIDKKPIDAIHDFTTSRTDRYRKAYGYLAGDKPRRCVFTGTTNRRRYLDDATGATGRRTWPVECRRVFATVGELVTAVRAVRDQLWAEAVVRYKAGEAFYVESDDVRFVREAADRRIEDPWAEVVENAIANGAEVVGFGLSAPVPANPTQITVPQLFDHVLQIPIERRTPTAGRRLTDVMHELGWERVKSNGVRLFRKS